MRDRTRVAIVVALAMSFARAAGAAEPVAAPDVTARAPATSPSAQDAPTPAERLAQADAAVDAGDLPLARALYERVVAESPGAPEANEARRALKILAARLAAPAPAASGGDAQPPASSGVVLRREPYSIKTKERLRLTAWEKLDFGTTAFLYGMSVGFSYGLSQRDQSSGAVLPPIALGALSYTLGAVVFLNAANPDRGDLPLALAITSYVPTTTLLVANFAFDHPDGHKTALATATAGLVSVPIAVYAAHELDLDPGDTQLVRDAGFWGLVLATAGTLGFGGSETTYYPGYTSYTAPTGRTIASAGFLGLYGGLGLGLLAAHASDVSLERVRVTTWGGYGGAIVGLLLAEAGGTSGNNEGTAYRGLSVGALAGLVVTFLLTRSLDGIPPEDAVASARPPKASLTPTFGPMAGIDGQTRAMLGLSGTLF